MARLFAWLSSPRGSVLRVAQFSARLGTLRGVTSWGGVLPAWPFSGKVVVSGADCLAPLTRLGCRLRWDSGASRSRRACSWICCESYRVAGPFGLSAVLVDGVRAL